MTIWHHFFQNWLFQNSATWRFWRFLVATFSNVIQIKLMIPIFHTEFDPLQVLFLSICKIPPTGDFGDFWWLLLVTSSKLNLWYQFFTQNLTLYMFLQFDRTFLARKFEQSQVGLTGLIKSQISQISAYFFVILLSLHLFFCKRIKWFGPKVLAISWCLHIF